MSDETTIKVDLAQLWKVSRTVKQMLRDRGYAIKKEELEISQEDFTRKNCDYHRTLEHASALDFLAHREDDPSEQVYVFFCAETNIRIKTIRAYFEQMAEHDLKHAILVYREAITSISQKTINTMAEKHVMETFSEKELVTNITEHCLVPQHIPQTDEEKKSVLKAYSLKESQVPRLPASDPVARYYGLKRGQLVKIIRESSTAGRYVFYRITV